MSSGAIWLIMPGDVYKWAAEMEREFIRERTREAIARLKAQEKPVGRPPK